MAKNKLLHEIPGIALTAARYGMAEHMARRVRADKPIAAHMAAFITADVADGALLRQFDSDTPVRRVADGVVDHASVARVACEIWKKHPAAKPYIGILAARAAIVGSLNALHLAKTGEVTKGRRYQKATNLAAAAFALAAASGNRKAAHSAGLIASGVAVATSFAHLKDLGIKHPAGIREL